MPAEQPVQQDPYLPASDTALTGGAVPSSASGTGLAPAPQPTSAASRYELLDEIAHGGMGIVYSARDVLLNREVAVKTLKEGYAPASEVARRFVAEAKITGQLQHPGIPAVHDLGTLPDGRPFLAMKLVKGSTLDHQLKARPDPGTDRGRFLAAFEQVCQAVAYAHAHETIHRDLKPGNIMVGAFGEVQVMDWGLAKVLTDHAEQDTKSPEDETTAAATQIHSDQGDGSATQAGSILGTPAYMPPEQAIGAIDKIDQRSDVFGLGGILCEMLTGRPPYVGPNSEHIRQQAARGQLSEALARLDGCGADPDLVALCKRCLAQEPADRPADAGVVAHTVAELRAAADERARQAELDRVQAEAEAREQRQRRRTQLVIAAAVILLAIGGGAFAWWQDRQATARQARLTRNAEALDALLTSSEEALRRGDADRAEAYLKEVERRHAEDGGETQKERFDARRADLAVLRDLDAVDRFRWTPIDNKLPQGNDIALKLKSAFEQFGADPEGPSSEEVALRIQRSAVRERLIAALDLWLQNGKSAGVRESLRVVDADAYREAVRDAVMTDDRARLAQLAAQSEAQDQPARFIEMLGGNLAILAERRRVLLEAAVRRWPGDLGLLMTLGHTYSVVADDGLSTDAKEKSDERLRWYQAAVAVAPGNVVAHLCLGNALYDTHDLEGAKLEFREAIRLDPKYALAYSNLGNALKATHDLEAAISAWREAIRLDPELSRTHHNLGEALLEKQDLEGAISAYLEAIRLNPEDAGPHVGLGNALLDKQDLEGAISAYREAIRLDPKDAKAQFNLGIALRGKEDLEGAISAYREAIRLDSKNANAYNNLGNVLLKKQDVEGAILAFREAIRLNPKDAQYHSNMGNALSDKHDIEGAISAYQVAIRLDPKDATAQFNLGNSLSHKQDFEGAILAYREAIRLDPKFVGAHRNLGLNLWANQNLEGAILAYREAIRLDPKDAKAYSGLGLALRGMQDLEGAIIAFREAIRLDPKYTSAHRDLGNALSDNQDLDGAILAYREAIRLDPKFSRVHVSLGNALSDNQDLEGAILAYREAIRLDPKYAAAHYNLGIALHGNQDLEGAILAYREAIRLDPKDAKAQFNLGIALRGKEDLEGAISAYREAIRLDSKYTKAHIGLGIVLREKGDLDGAIAAYQEALRLTPKNAYIQQSLTQMQRWKELLPRIPDLAAGRKDSLTPVECREFANLCSQPFQRRYLLAIQLHRQAFAAEPKFAQNPSSSDYFDGARNAVLAANGKDREMTTLGVEEWGFLTDQARAWLRADLTRTTKQAKDAGNNIKIRDKLNHWKVDPDLTAVRDPAYLAAMPPSDRETWRKLWADVDALLATVSPKP